MYIITDTHKIYIGDQLYAAGGSSLYYSLDEHTLLEYTDGV